MKYSFKLTSLKFWYGRKENPSWAVQSVIEFIAPQRAYMHWGGSSKNKINLQLNKNTILIIQSWKMFTISHHVFFFWITSDSHNQLPIQPTEMTTHRVSFTLVWSTAQDWDLWYTQLSKCTSTYWFHSKSAGSQELYVKMLLRNKIMWPQVDFHTALITLMWPLPCVLFLGSNFSVCLCTFRWPSLIHMLSPIFISTGCNRLVTWNFKDTHKAY